MSNETIGQSGAGQQTRIVGKGKATADGPGPEIMAADTLTGNDVYNPANEKLGTIQDIMLDVPHGRVAYAVLSHGGVLGMGDRQWAQELYEYYDQPPYW